MGKVSRGLGSVFTVKLEQRHRTLRPAGAAWLRTCTERKLKPCGGGGLLAGAKAETQWFRGDNFRHAPSVVTHVHAEQPSLGNGVSGWCVGLYEVHLCTNLTPGLSLSAWCTFSSFKSNFMGIPWWSSG